MTIYKLDTDEKLMNIIRNNRYVVIKFTATWCKPCHMIQPDFENCAKQNPNIIFGIVDINEMETFCDSHGINSIPMFYIFENKKVLKIFKGAGDEFKSMLHFIPTLQAGRPII